MKYPLTFYWDKGVDDGHGASTRLCFIFMRQKYKDKDEGLYQHELTHVKQWSFVTLVVGLLIAAVYPPHLILFAGTVHPLLNAAIPKYRLWAEVQAFKKQLKYYPDDRTVLLAGFIVNNYGLDISQGEAEALLKSCSVAHICC